jgi:Tfp pilus assembly protein PilX
MTRPDLHSERGFTMIAVLIVMTVATVVASGVLLAAQHDLPFSKASSDRKQAYAAAEAGVEYYLYQLTNDNDYWTKCTNVPAPAPINQKGATTRKWRTLSGTKARYTIELMPASGATCVEGSADTTMLNQSTGTIKIRATGEAGGTKRSIVAEYRRDSFLDFLYFTDFETFSPEAYDNQADRDWAAANCGKYRNFRSNADGTNPCAKIRFISDDKNLGPFHTNDDILACGNYTLGRNAADKIEIAGPNKWQNPGSSASCDSGQPNVQGTLDYPAARLPMPTTNADVRNKAAAAYTYTGRTWIRLRDTVMDVTTWNSSGTAVTNTQALPTNGVISVRNGACTSIQPPVRQSYSEPAGCANVTVWGSYAQSLTITSEKDIIVGTPVDPTNNTPLYSNADLTRNGDVVLGLIADKFVRVSHAVSRSGGCFNRNATNGTTTTSDDRPMTDIKIEAAILSLLHSFIVDNYECGDELGTLTVMGAIAQRYRGPVGTSGSSDRTGFTKNYEYDDRFRYRSPPFFLTPIDAAWNITRENEQAPAARGNSESGQGVTRTLSSSSRSSTASPGSSVTVSCDPAVQGGAMKVTIRWTPAGRPSTASGSGWSSPTASVATNGAASVRPALRSATA